MIGGQHAYVLVKDWLGAPPPPLGRDAGLAELARRYLAGHGPASDRDFAKWAGLRLGEARRGFSGISSSLRELPDGTAELTGTDPEAGGLPGPRLLGAYDPVLLGWASRTPILVPHQQIVTVNGLFRPFVLVAGKAVGMWTWSAGRVVLDRFGEQPADVEDALAAEAEDVRRFLGTGAAASDSQPE